MILSDNAMDTFIKKVAGNVANNFPSYVTRDDVAHHLWVWFLDNEYTVTSLIRDNESWEPMLYGTMVRVASTYALEEEAATNGYSTDDVYHYSTTVVRELLKDAFDYEDWQSFSTFGDGQPKSKVQSNQTGDRMAMLADVKTATENLNDDQYNVILWTYKFGFDAKALAEQLEVTETAARKRLERAVKAVQRGLGRKGLADMRNGWEGRTTERPSNAQALSLSESQYNG